MGRPSPECRHRLTSGKSPVQESCTPGSEGEVSGDRHLYPTQDIRFITAFLRLIKADIAAESLRANPELAEGRSLGAKHLVGIEDGGPIYSIYVAP